MKTRRNLSVAIIVLALASGARAQGEQPIGRKDVPAAVLSAFQSSYPHGVIRGFARETKNGTRFFEIQSVEGSIHRDLLYTGAGNIVEIEETFPPDQIPPGVQRTLKENFAGTPVQRIERVTRGSNTTYEATIGKGKSRQEIVMNADGAIQQKGMKTR